MALPYANLFWTAILAAIIGLILASAFSAILVYAQELVPGKVGLMAGLFFGLAFGMGGIGSAVLGAWLIATAFPSSSESAPTFRSSVCSPPFYLT